MCVREREEQCECVSVRERECVWGWVGVGG